MKKWKKDQEEFDERDVVSDSGVLENNEKELDRGQKEERTEL